MPWLADPTGVFCLSLHHRFLVQVMCGAGQRCAIGHSDSRRDAAGHKEVPALEGGHESTWRKS